ncbi:Chromate resistance protein ChrB [Streptomyces sp. NPDC086554]|uniref:Chromate resistance protein ChrB n=1 Tax=Streptomyces sp. NPDC086554 TaxID=3154864 RepID=UPI00343B0B3A
MAVWRELRRIGALSLGQGIWAVPDAARFREMFTAARSADWTEFADCGKFEEEIAKEIRTSKFTLAELDVFGALHAGDEEAL